MSFSVPAVATADELPRDRVLPDAVVRPLSRVADRPCARPGCPAPARATLTFAYRDREALIERLQDTSEPQAYDLCTSHATRTRPPHGWTLRDRRPEEDRRADPPPVAPADLGGEHTVAVLAAALRAVPSAAPESDAPNDEAADLAEPDAGEAVTASVSRDAPVTAGTTLASDPEDDPSPVLGADRTSAEQPQSEEPSTPRLAEDEPPAPQPRPPLAMRDS